MESEEERDKKRKNKKRDKNSCLFIFSTNGGWLYECKRKGVFKWKCCVAFY